MIRQKTVIGSCEIKNSELIVMKLKITRHVRHVLSEKQENPSNAICLFFLAFDPKVSDITLETPGLKFKTQ